MGGGRGSHVTFTLGHVAVTWRPIRRGEKRRDVTVSPSDISNVSLFISPLFLVLLFEFRHKMALFRSDHVTPAGSNQRPLFNDVASLHPNK